MTSSPIAPTIGDIARQGVAAPRQPSAPGPRAGSPRHGASGRHRPSPPAAPRRAGRRPPSVPTGHLNGDGPSRPPAQAISRLAVLVGDVAMTPASGRLPGAAVVVHVASVQEDWDAPGGKSRSSCYKTSKVEFSHDGQDQMRQIVLWPSRASQDTRLRSSRMTPASRREAGSRT